MYYGLLGTMFSIIAVFRELAAGTDAANQAMLASDLGSAHNDHHGFTRGDAHSGGL